MLPGLADSHLHVFALGKASTQVDLEGCRSIEELQRRLREHPETAPYLEGAGRVRQLGWPRSWLGSGTLGTATFEVGGVREASGQFGRFTWLKLSDAGAWHAGF